MIVPPAVQKWILLNIVRFLTIVSCVLVITSSCVILKKNFANAKNPTTSSDSYIPGTDIPTHVWGECWSFIHHFSTLITLFLLLLSEFPLPGTWTDKSIGGLVQKFFHRMIPFLSRESSVGISGAVMISTGADGLSRSIGGKLSLVSNWLLVSLGLINILLSLIFRSELKKQRSFLFFKNPEVLSQSLPLPNSISSKIVEKGSTMFFSSSKLKSEPSQKEIFSKVPMPSRSMGGDQSSFKSKAKDFYFQKGGGNQSQASMVSVLDEEKFHYLPPSIPVSRGAPSIKTTAPSDYSYHPYEEQDRVEDDDDVKSNYTGKKVLPQNRGNGNIYLDLPPSQPFRKSPSSHGGGSSIPDSESYYGEGLDAISLPSRVPFRPNQDEDSNSRFRSTSPLSGFRSEINRSISGRSVGTTRSRNDGKHLDHESEEEEAREFERETLKRTVSKSSNQSKKSIRRIPPPPLSISSLEEEALNLPIVEQGISPAERSPGLVASWRAAALEARIKAQAVKEKQRRSLKLGKKFGLNESGSGSQGQGSELRSRDRKADVEEDDYDDSHDGDGDTNWDGTTLRQMEEVDGNDSRIRGKRGRKLEMIQRRG